MAISKLLIASLLVSLLVLHPVEVDRSAFEAVKQKGPKLRRPVHCMYFCLIQTTKADADMRP
ncbi:unnamed protein product [Dovyalis caffra]|uniref:Uncharacterized protein n=1 Tax=Dovyalis caffra TaxID=77055 RepID=A0AAV1S8S5_9ROSI|nr:unnamed protein product [Dovyalis caffra]